ncbi:MAG TPA: S-methyl-5'-thioadenosine phosphorylase [Polyangiaceae bacterium]|nr:S-methyl-5'-thioadenosine phosphorylase [Polyangiaceae bacterium]
MANYPEETSDVVPLAVLGGTGLSSMAGLTVEEERAMSTPYGPPSDTVRIGRLGGRRVAFLARHGRHHTLLPSEIPFRANIHALRQLGVRWVLSASAVGSLRRELAPGHFVVPLQMLDRTKQRDEHTFFGRGIVAHVAFSRPVCGVLAEVLSTAARDAGAKATLGGTYVNMEGPAFSTRAESEWHRSLGCDIVGMTNLAEAKLCREAEMSYATLAMVTDYDAFGEHGEPGEPGDQDVHVGAVVQQLQANAALAQRALALAIARVPLGESPPAHSALKTAILTPRAAWPEGRVAELAPFLSRYA